MCRLMGYVAKEGTSVSEFAGANFVEFKELSDFHRDGWGIVTSDGSSKPELLVEPKIAKESSKFSEATSKLTSDAALLHLRWATGGLEVSEGNTHPFVYQQYSFIHNGGVFPPDSLDKFVEPKFKSLMRGTTDSERYFYVLISEIEKHGLGDGVLSAVRKVRDNCDFSSLNAMLLTPTEFIIINEHNNERIPKGQPDDYYDLLVRTDEKGVLVASSGWTQDGWKLIANHQVLVIDRSTYAKKDFAL